MDARPFWETELLLSPSSPLHLLPRIRDLTIVAHNAQTIIPLQNIIVLALVPCCISPLSIAASLIIIYRILKFDRYDPGCTNRRVYHRLLLGLSSSNIVECIAIQFGCLPVPRETGLWGAHGNTATCTVQGFFILVSSGAVLFYNVGLMIYFLCTIRYNWSETYFTKYMEWIIHLWSLAAPFGAGATCLVYEAFNPSGFGTYCNIGASPLACETGHSACTRGTMAPLLFRDFFIIPCFICTPFLFLSIILIFLAVKRQGRRALDIAANPESILTQTKAVAVQSILFGLIFFNSYVYTLVLICLLFLRGSAHVGLEPQYLRIAYAFNLITAFFYPMQGFLNCILYLRPRYIRLKQEGNLSCWHAFQRAAFGGRETFRSTTTASRRRSTLQCRVAVGATSNNSSRAASVTRSMLSWPTTTTQNILQTTSHHPSSSLGGVLSVAPPLENRMESSDAAAEDDRINDATSRSRIETENDSNCRGISNNPPRHANVTISTSQRDDDDEEDVLPASAKIDDDGTLMLRNNGIQ